MTEDTRINDLEVVLKKAHDKLDDQATMQGLLGVVSCRWCWGVGYDENGLKHNPECVLLDIRRLIKT